MSVLIKGVALPLNCDLCPCMDGEYLVCRVTGLDPYLRDNSQTRPDSCPLVEVKTPHGNLIDSEQLCNALDQIEFDTDADYVAVDEARLNQITVIKAEE